METTDCGILAHCLESSQEDPEGERVEIYFSETMAITAMIMAKPKIK